MYLESYTNIMKSYFSFLMLLRFKHCSVSMATTPVQAFLCSHLAHCKRFMTCLPSVSSSLKPPCPLLPDSPFYRFVFIVLFIVSDSHGAFISIIKCPQMYLLGISLHSHGDPLMSKSWVLFLLRVYNATEDGDHIMHLLYIPLAPGTTLGSWYVHNELNISSFTFYPWVHLVLSIPTWSKGCFWLFCGVNFFLFPKIVDSFIAYLIQSFQYIFKNQFHDIFFLKYRSLSLPKTTMTQLLACLKWFLQF